jgi:uncharacterized protein (DUF736 family)
MKHEVLIGGYSILQTLTNFNTIFLSLHLEHPNFVIYVYKNLTDKTQEQWSLMISSSAVSPSSLSQMHLRIMTATSQEQ